MLFSVPGGTSRFNLPPPATVTVPGFVGWRYCMCAPTVRSRRQPSASICLITARYFIRHPPVYISPQGRHCPPCLARSYIDGSWSAGTDLGGREDLPHPLVGV